MPYKIQQLKLGGILDQAIAITKDHFGLLFGIMACLLIPFQLIQGFLQLTLFPELTSGATPQELTGQLNTSLYLLFTFVFMVLAGLVITPLTNAAAIHAVSRLYLGQRISAVESIKRGFRSLLPLVWTTMLFSFVFIGGFILFIIPGILFALWFGLYQQVVVVEGISGFAALQRSKQLVRGHLLTFIALTLMMIVIVWAVLGGVFFIPQLHVQMVVRVLLLAILTVLATATWVVFYFSCRCAVENFDLTYLAESIGVAAPEPEVEAAGI
jgi:hypothetical protein